MSIRCDKCGICAHCYTLCPGCSRDEEIRRLRECDTKDAQENAALKARVKELEHMLRINFGEVCYQIPTERLKELEQAEADAERLREALIRSRRGIQEAIISEDGLDGAEGEEIIIGIDAALRSASEGGGA